MNKSLIVLALVGLATPSLAHANGITNSITDSVSLTVQGAAVQTNRIGSSYSVSGSNIAVTSNGAFGGLTGGSATAAATLTDGSYEVNTAGQSFSFSESGTIGDTAITSQTQANGNIAAPSIYGNATTQLGGNAGTLAGTLSATGIPTVTAGGPGTTAVGQRTVELSVFQ
jgi:hypothetical protein